MLTHLLGTFFSILFTVFLAHCIDNTSMHYYPEALLDAAFTGLFFYIAALLAVLGARKYQ